MRELKPYQTSDPARGSFLVRPNMTKELSDGRRVFVAPTEPGGGQGGAYQTYGNAIQFIPIKE